MNDIMQVNEVSKTMSSREIADLCGKEHRNVCRDIDTLNESYEQMGLLKVEQGYYTLQNTGNQQHRQFLLSKEQTIDLITGYRADIRIRINRRWQELEQQVSASQPVMAMPDFTNPAEAARAFADQYEAKQIAQEQLALAQPKVNFYNTVAASNSLMTVSDVAKKMDMSAQALNVRLIEIGAYDKRRLPKKVFSHGFISKGYGAMKLTADGHDRNLLTQAGQIYVIGLFSCNKELEPM